MFNQMKFCFFFLVVIAFVFFQCSDSKNPADTAPSLGSLPNIKGEWVLEWENKTYQIQLDPESKRVLLDGNDGYELDLDSVGIRIRPFDEESIKGYFLYSDLKSKSWIGTWENRVVRLIRKN